MAVALALLASLATAPAGAAPQTPAQHIASLKAEAARAQSVIDGMNNGIERLAEQYDASTEALGATLAQEQRTRLQLAAASAALRVAQSLLDHRVRSMYIAGPSSGLAELLGVTDVHDALTTATYQQRVVSADDNAIAAVVSAKAALARVAGQLGGQERAQRTLQARLLAQRDAISSHLAAERVYLSKVSAQVKAAIDAERKRQEALRRQAYLRKLAAERALQARLQAARLAAERANQFRATTSGPTFAVATPPPSPAAAVAAAISFARAQLGKPYLWGGSGPGAFDCSGLTMMAYASAGVSLPRTAAEQWYAGPHVGIYDLAPGDLVFYAFDTSNPSTIHHVALYIGGGLMIEAPHTGSFVRISTFDRPDYIGATRPV